MKLIHSEPAGPDTVIVHVGTCLDFRTAGTFKGHCQQYLGAGISKFVLDFSGTGILDSTGLGAIFSLHRQVNPQGGRVAFASVSRQVKAVVQMTGTHKLFKQYETVDDATGGEGSIQGWAAG